MAPLPAYLRFSWFDLNQDELTIILNIVPGLNVRRDLQGLRHLLQCLVDAGAPATRNLHEQLSAVILLAAPGCEPVLTTYFPAAMGVRPDNATVYHDFMHYINNIINAIDIMQKKIIDAIILDESFAKLSALTDTLEERTMALDVGELVITDAKTLAREVLTLYQDVKIRYLEFYRTSTPIVAEDLLHLFRAVSQNYVLMPQLTIHDIRE